jgi:hypothetical protein
VSDVLEALRPALAAWRGERPLSAEPIPGGANAEVFRVLTGGGAVYCAKRYRRREGDPVDRLAAEFGALSFLWAQGVRQVPEPVGAIAGEGIGVYGFVEGRRIAAAEVDDALLDQMAAFFLLLHGLRAAPGAAALPVAREACFSLDAHRGLIAGRLHRLREAGAGGALRRFLDGEFAPLLERVRAAVAAGAARAGIDPAADLPGAERTLSPSDAGFHNTLLRPDGTLVFLDFEYFGWDDPAKLVADFFLQPQAPLAPPLRSGFLARLAPGLAGRPGFRERLALLYPLLALKWCLIMLNVYLRPALPGREAVENREGQLARAAAALGALRTECENRLFPCDGFGL